MGENLSIRGEGSKRDSTFCSAARARKYLQNGCKGFLAYVIDTREEKKGYLAELLVVCKFPDVFPEDLAGVSKECQVEFWIDLVPGVAPVSKVSYHLAPVKMQE